jgi:hypothetical protein
MSIYLSDLDTENENYAINIIRQGNADRTGDNRFVIKGAVMNSELSVRGGNSYDTLMDRAGVLGNFVGKAAGLATDIRDLMSIGGGANISATPKELTKLVWSGSDTPVFTVNVIFICKKSTDSKERVIPKVNAIMEYLYPTTGKTFKAKGINAKLTVLSAPMQYNGFNQDGLVTLRLGTFFRASNLVIESAQFDYSKELNAVGEPIYAVGQVILKPVRAVTFKEFNSYFIR